MEEAIEKLEEAKAADNAADKDRLIDEAIALLSGPVLTWAETDVLKLFVRFQGRPGKMIPVKNLLMTWGTTGTNQQFVDALRSLIAKGLIQANATETEVALTDAGYQ